MKQYAPICITPYITAKLPIGRTVNLINVEIKHRMAKKAFALRHCLIYV